LNDWNVWVS